MDKKKLTSLFFEIIRFGIVGFVSFLFDYGMFMFILHILLNSEKSALNVAVSTAAGFIVGVTVNYILSILFVFRASAEKGHGKDFKSKLIFLIMAAIGLILTEIIMHAGVVTLLLDESLVKVSATLIVMVWNYISRKIFIFKDK